MSEWLVHTDLELMFYVITDGNTAIYEGTTCSASAHAVSATELRWCPHLRIRNPHDSSDTQIAPTQL